MTSLVALAICVIAAGACCAWIVIAGLALKAAPCPHDPPLRIGQVKEPLVIVGACLIGFGLGHGLAHLRGFRYPTVGHGSMARRRRAAIAVQAVLTTFLLMVVLLLAFETYALAVGIWPITYYVRCSNEIAAWAAVPAAGLVCFLLGRWLWYPRVS